MLIRRRRRRHGIRTQVQNEGEIGQSAIVATDREFITRENTSFIPSYML